MSREIAKALLDIKAVSLSPNEPYTWASGIKSPIYCDNRYILSFPEKRNLVVKKFCELIKKEYSNVEMIMGTATAGIPWASLIAQELNLPMGYVRSGSKDHGKQNQIEGKLVDNQKVLVIEDLISTGGSVKTVIESLREEKQDVLAVLSIFTYQLQKATDCFKELNLNYVSLSNYDDLLEVAIDLDYIKDKDLLKLRKWKVNPSDSSWLDL